MNKKPVAMSVSKTTVSFSAPFIQRFIYNGVIVNINNGQATVINCDDGADARTTMHTNCSKFNIEDKEENYGTYELIETKPGVFEGNLVSLDIDLSTAKRTIDIKNLMQNDDIRLTTKDVSISSITAKNLNYSTGNLFNVNYFEKENILVFKKNNCRGAKLHKQSDSSRLYMSPVVIADFIKRNKEYRIYADKQYIVITGIQNK